jgi:hypothetical protein
MGDGRRKMEDGRWEIRRRRALEEGQRGVKNVKIGVKSAKLIASDQQADGQRQDALATSEPSYRVDSSRLTILYLFDLFDLFALALTLVFLFLVLALRARRGKGRRRRLRREMR